MEVLGDLDAGAVPDVQRGAAALAHCIHRLGELRVAHTALQHSEPRDQ